MPAGESSPGQPTLAASEGVPGMAESAAEAELRQLCRMLSAQSDLKDSSFGFTCEEVSARLALFSWRFGRQPQETGGWGTLAETARALLARIERDVQRPVADIALPDGWFGPPWSLPRALLLDVGGRPDEARTLLFEPDRILRRHCCGMHVTCDEGMLALARSEHAQRHADAARALLHVQQAILFRESWQGFEDAPGRAALNDARLGILLLEAGREADAVTVFESLLSARPEGIGAAIAEAELGRRGVPPTERRGRMELVRLDRDDDWHFRPGALLLGREGEPDSWRVLALRLWPRDGEQVNRDASPWVAGDPVDGIVEALDAAVARPHRNAHLPLAASLVSTALGHRHEVDLRAALDECARGRTEGFQLQQLDQLLRIACSGGPPLGKLRDRSAKEVSDAWSAWLNPR
jgi:hypothetical protein